MAALAIAAACSRTPALTRVTITDLMRNPLELRSTVGFLLEHDTELQLTRTQQDSISRLVRGLRRQTAMLWYHLDSVQVLAPSRLAEPPRRGQRPDTTGLDAVLASLTNGDSAEPPAALDAVHRIRASYARADSAALALLTTEQRARVDSVRFLASGRRLPRERAGRRAADSTASDR